jgi:hypothetical protein
MSESTALTLPERAAVALGTPKYEQEIRELVAKTVTITEVKNKDGRDQCHGAMMTLKNTRVAIEKAAKAAREDATAFSKAVIAEEKRLVALAEPEEARLQALRDAWDAEIEREKAAKAAAEKARVDGIRKRIAEMQSIPAMLVGKQSATIATAIEGLEAVEITLEIFMECAGEAELAKIATVAKLGEMLTAQVAHEKEQERLAEERAELERLRREAAERERQIAEARALDERLASEAREREEARLRAEREAHEAELRKQREEAEAILRGRREAEEAMLAAQRAEIAKQQAEIAAAKAEQERIERDRQAEIEAEARAKREAEEAAARAEAARIRAEQDAAITEQKRRERVEFIKNGPGDVEILKLVASHYGVTYQTACNWVGKIEFIEFPDVIETEKAA